MQKTTLEQWRMLKAVIEYGGFSQAAQAIHKSQSSIHHAVHKLEEILNLKLLEIQGRKAFLTEHGKLLLQRGNHVLQEVERLEAVADVMSSGVEAELSIAVDGAFPQCLLLDVLSQVSAKYPTLKISIFETILSGTNELIAQGKVSLGLSHKPMEGCLNEEICLIEFIAVASPEHFLHLQDNPISLDQLKSSRQIVVRDSAALVNASEGWLGADQRWTVSSMRASIDLVARNIGFAWLPLPEIQGLIADNRLKPLNLDNGKSRSVAFYLNFQDELALGLAAREFMGELRYSTLDMPTSDEN